MPITLAKIMDLHIYAVDQSPHCKTIVTRNADEAGFSDNLPFDDNSIDLIMSKRSVMFWNDFIAAFNEINRVLKLGGSIYIGGAVRN